MSASDFVCEQMDSAVDNLEITAVYGTQDVTIKREEESAVFIKEEESISDAELRECCSFGTSETEHGTLAIPLVYTTKLDQMNALNKIERHTIEETTEMILAESRPRYNQLPVSIKTEPSSETNVTSYIKLCCQVQQLNTKVKTETYLRNQKLLKMCKPLNIVLVDCKTNRTLQSENKILDYTEVEDYSSDEYVPASYSSDDEPMSKTMTYTHVTKTKTAKVCPTTVTVVIKDKRSQEADIYILDTNKGVKSYYRTSIDECDRIQKLHLSCKAMLLEYCCWANREKRINKLIRLGFTKILTRESAFLRKPHNCFPRPCSCCCVMGNTMLKKSSNDEFIKFINKQSINEDVTTFIPIMGILKNNDIIEKSKNYMPKVLLTVRDTIPPAQTNATNDYLKRAVIIIKYHRILFLQTQLFGENYEIGNKGEIVTFMKPTVNRSITEEKQSYEIIDATSKITRTYFSYMICCWHYREDILIHQLRDFNKLSPSAFRFIRTPHLCRSDICECCCKPIPLIKYKLDNISSTRTTYAYNKKQVQAKVPNTDVYLGKQVTNRSIRTSLDRSTLKENIIQDSEKRKTKNTTDIPTTSPPQSKRTTVNPIKKSTEPMSHINEVTVQNNIYLNDDPIFQQKPIRTYSKKTTLNQVRVPSPSNVSNTINLDNGIILADSATPATLTNSILEQFKDLKLSVNENGKLSAMINASPGQLSTVEIKIISDILSLASKQIEELGITPEEFANRVNSSRVASDSKRPPNVLINLPPRLHYITKVEAKVKAQPLNCLVPATRNKSPVSSIFQMISSVGGQKNQHLVQAYKLYFESNKSCSVPRPPPPQKHDSATPEKAKTLVPVVKRKMEAKPAQKRLRVIAPKAPKNPQPPPLISLKPKRKLNSINRLSTILGKVKNAVISTKPNQMPVLVSDSNLKPFQNISGANIPQPVVDGVHSQIPIYIINSNVIQTRNMRGTNAVKSATGVVNNQTPVVNNNSYLSVHNTSGTINAAKGVEHNQTSFLFNNSVIPVNNTSDTTVLQPAMDSINDNNIPTKNTGDVIVLDNAKRFDLNQTPYFVNNSNILPIDNSSDPLGLQSEIVTDDINQITPFVNNSNVVPVENTSDPLSLQSEIVTDVNQIPHLVNNSNVVPVDNTSDIISWQPEMVTDTNKLSVFFNNSDVIPAHSTIDLTESEMETDNQGPLFDTSIIPSQSTSDATTPNVHFVAKAPTGSVPVGNPILYQMLAKKSPMLPPIALAPTSLQPRATQSSVRPLILAHSKKKPFKKRTRRNILPRNKPLVIENAQNLKKNNPSNTGNEMVIECIASNSGDDNMDIEKTLKTNFIMDVTKSTQYSEDEILLAVNNKQLFEEDKEECIFGV